MDARQRETSCMNAPVFVDTNIFVYAWQANEPVRQGVAADWIDRLWADGRGRTSIQVLTECQVTLTRRIRPSLLPDVAWKYVSTLMAWNPQPLNAELASRARELERRYRLLWWDSLVVAAAQVQGCGTLLTEGMDEQAVYGGVRVCNPFSMALQDAAESG